MCTPSYRAATSPPTTLRLTPLPDVVFHSYCDVIVCISHPVISQCVVSFSYFSHPVRELHCIYNELKTNMGSWLHSSLLYSTPLAVH